MFCNRNLALVLLRNKNFGKNMVNVLSINSFNTKIWDMLTEASATSHITSTTLCTVQHTYVGLSVLTCCGHAGNENSHGHALTNELDVLTAFSPISRVPMFSKLSKYRTGSGGRYVHQL